MQEEILTETLRIETNFPDFMSFYNESEETIYRKILEIFEDLKTSNKDQKQLIIIANIDGFVFDTIFYILKDNHQLITDVIRPYFERMEDYETCEKIVKICKQP